MRILSITLLIVVLTACSSSGEPIEVNINTGEVITDHFIGNGVQLDPYPHADTEDAEWGLLMTGEKWERVYHRLDYMKPRFMRIVDQANWRYLKGFDENNMPVLDFDTDEEKVLEQLLSYCQQNDIIVMLGEWGVPYAVHDVDEGFSEILTGANDERWISMIVKHLDYLINQKGFTCIRYFNLVNEPNGAWASTNGNWNEWSEGVKLLASAIEEAGLSDKVSVAGPDAVAHYDHPNEPLTGMEWVDSTATHLADQVGALDVHAYFEPDVIRDGKLHKLYSPLVDLSRKIDKPILFGEVGFAKESAENQERIKNDPHTSSDSNMSVYDYSYGMDMANAIIQIMNTGFHGAAAWALDDAMHTIGDMGEKSQLKRWGFWNSLGTEIAGNPADENIRPWFFTWSLLCRYIQPGSKIIETEVRDCEGVRITTAIKDNDLTIAIVNTTGKEQVLNINSSILIEDGLKQFVYSEKGYKTDRYGFPVANPQKVSFKNATLTTTVSANGFMLLTSYRY